MKQSEANICQWLAIALHFPLNSVMITQQYWANTGSRVVPRSSSNIAQAPGFVEHRNWPNSKNLQTSACPQEAT